jgi:tRNA (uracil-5-)-methyltransferase TRM9
MDLYTTHAEEFSKTRSSPWNGWKVLLNGYQSAFSQKPRILDLGCGNGRFAKFLVQNQISFEYVGVDSSVPLLKIAQTNLPYNDFKFIQVDLNSTSWPDHIQEDFDIIVAFGFMHHLETLKIRKFFFEKNFELLKIEGKFFAAFWQFAKLERYKNKIYQANKYPDEKYNQNDFLMDFGASRNSRFCHYYSEEEMQEIESSVNFQIIETFFNDGRDNNENLYKVYTKP